MKKLLSILVLLSLGTAVSAQPVQKPTLPDVAGPTTTAGPHGSAPSSARISRARSGSIVAWHNDGAQLQLSPPQGSCMLSFVESSKGVVEPGATALGDY